MMVFIKISKVNQPVFNPWPKSIHEFHLWGWIAHLPWTTNLDLSVTKICVLQLLRNVGILSFKAIKSLCLLWKCITCSYNTHIWGLLTTKSDMFNLLQSPTLFGLVPTRGGGAKRTSWKLSRTLLGLWVAAPAFPAGLTLVRRGRGREIFGQNQLGGLFWKGEPLCEKKCYS